MLCLQFPKALLIMERTKKAPKQLYLLIRRNKSSQIVLSESQHLPVCSLQLCG